MSGGDVFPFTPPPLAGGYGIGTVLYSEGDPGSVGAGVVWVQASTGTTKVRNTANTGWVTIATSGGGITNPMTTAGDLIAGGASGAPTRLPGAAGVLHGAVGSGPSYGLVLPADLDVTADNTTANATTGHHGLLPKLGGGTANFLRADGSWSAPATSASRYGCTIKKASDQNILNGTLVPINYDATDVYDPLNMHDPAVTPDQIVIPTGGAGVWAISTQLTWDASAASGARGLYVSVNGAYAYTIDFRNPIAYSYATVADIITVADGDIVRFVAYQESGGTRVISGASARAMLANLYRIGI